MLNQLLTRWGVAGLLLFLLGGYWLLPISGRVVIEPGEVGAQELWPRFTIQPPAPQLGQEAIITVSDQRSWANVALTVNGKQASFDSWTEHRAMQAYTWRWRYTPSEEEERPGGEMRLAFFVDCHTGCRTRGELVIGGASNLAAEPVQYNKPTKLCTAFADPKRDWHGRSGWTLDVTYAKLADDTSDPFWGINALAERTAQAQAKGLRVLIRIDYDRNQSLPPTGNNLALRDYLAYTKRLARDERLQAVHAFVIGAIYNSLENNQLAGGSPVTPEWAARIINGYSEAVDHDDNVVQVMRSENPPVRLVVGPVRPWVNDQTGTRRFRIDVPWLNYFNTLVADLDQSANEKMQAGIPLSAPDGFAIQTGGRPSASELSDNGANDPLVDLRKPAWQGAQSGFRVYQDWLEVINSYPSTRQLPVYITSANTFAPDEGTPPAQNYPAGWLTNALAEVNHQPQIQTLCWFLDLIPGDSRWDDFSLARKQGKLIYAAEEFEKLLVES